MARYMVSVSYINLIGSIWYPNAGVCAQHKVLDGRDIEHLRDTDGRITRGSIEHWLTLNAGDFSQVLDFEAGIEDHETLDFPWRVEESELTYNDCMYPSEDSE